MNIKPLTNRVVIEIIQQEDKNSSGLYIPDNAKEQSTTGIVVAVGPDCKSVTDKDKVIFTLYSGTEIEQEGKKFLIMQEDDILATL